MNRLLFFLATLCLTSPGLAHVPGGCDTLFAGERMPFFDLWLVQSVCVELELPEDEALYLGRRLMRHYSHLHVTNSISRKLRKDHLSLKITGPRAVLLQAQLIKSAPEASPLWDHRLDPKANTVARDHAARFFQAPSHPLDRNRSYREGVSVLLNFDELPPEPAKLMAKLMALNPWLYVDVSVRGDSYRVTGSFEDLLNAGLDLSEMSLQIFLSPYSDFYRIGKFKSGVRPRIRLVE